jgi:hypothetical protein
MPIVCAYFDAAEDGLVGGTGTTMASLRKKKATSEDAAFLIG